METVYPEKNGWKGNLGVDQRHCDMSIGDHLSEALAKLCDGLDKTGVDGSVGHPLVLHRLAHDADAPLDWHPPVRLPVLIVLAEPLSVVLLSDSFSLRIEVKSGQK